MTLDIGYNSSTLQRYFIGYVERSSTASTTPQVPFCRELAAILANPLPLNLRHVDLRAVLVEIGQHTGLRFRVPEHPYASVKAPFFYALAAGYQAMDSLARVVAVADAPAGAGICDDLRPRYVVDIEVMGSDGEPDTKLPILAGVSLPLPTGGEEMGIYAFPEKGTQVVVCFAYGLPHSLHIQTILPHGLSMPSVPKGDQVWQHSEACQQRVDADGKWLRQNDGKIVDKATEREVEAMSNTERFKSHTRMVDDHSTELVGGIKKLEALGSLELLSGGSASLAAVGDLHQATERDLNQVVGQKLNATVSDDMEERIQCLRNSGAEVSQRMVAPKTWGGSEGLNVLQVLCDLLELVEQMNIQIAVHVHAPNQPPNNAVLFTIAPSTARQHAAKLKLITSMG